jgi:prepilin-type N-terminal cleavage/methylation domain-containing protein
MRLARSDGFTLIEVLAAMAVAAVAMSVVTALLGASVRAVRQSELETTATWVAVRTIESWHAGGALVSDGEATLDRAGRPVEPPGLFQLEWRSQPDALSPGLVRCDVTVASPALEQPVRLTAESTGGSGER